MERATRVALALAALQLGGCSLIDALGGSSAASDGGIGGDGGLPAHAGAGNSLFGDPIPSDIGEPLTGLARASAPAAVLGGRFISLDRNTGDLYVLSRGEGPVFGFGYDTLGAPDAVAFAVGDFDQDGLDDIVTANGTAGSLTFFVQQLDPAGPPFDNGSVMPIADGEDVTAVAVAQLDDQYPEILAGYRNELVVVHFDEATGMYMADTTLTLPLAHPMRTIAIADIDRDGSLDILAGSDTDSAVVYGLNSPPWKPGDIEFVAGCSGGGAIEIADGYEEFIVARPGNVGLCVVRVSGRKYSNDDQSFGGRASVLAATDLNADGSLDFLAGEANGNQLHPAFGESFLFPNVDIAAVGSMSGMVLDDRDGDGRPDVVLATESPTGIAVLPGL